MLTVYPIKTSMPNKIKQATTNVIAFSPSNKKVNAMIPLKSQINLLLSVNNFLNQSKSILGDFVLGLRNSPKINNKNEMTTKKEVYFNAPNNLSLIDSSSSYSS
jgi:hypothetical protein